MNNETFTIFFCVNAKENSLRRMAQAAAAEYAAANHVIVVGDDAVFGAEVPADLLRRVRRYLAYYYDEGEDSPYEDDRCPLALELAQLL